MGSGWTAYVKARVRARRTKVRIHELTLGTNDPAAQWHFWGEVLGVPVHAGARGAVTVALGGTVLHLEPAAAGIDARYHFAINVPRGRIRDAAAWIADRHELLAFHGDPDEEEGATVVGTDSGSAALYFLDAGGNVVELIANGHLANDSDALFGADSLLEIAEIGVATADTDRMRRVLMNELSAPILWGGREGSLLTAIGDERGVVIVAPTGRGWIPTGLPAQALPTTIVAAGPRPRDATFAEGPYRIRVVTDA
jgi:catechol 2,3-dioxygenase-like lactoylglutathione lyase family enzyme